VPAERGTLVQDTVASAALAGNPLGDSPRRHVAVYLPPGYAASRRRYPVVYLLHGFFGRPDQWTERFDVAQAMDSLIAAGAVRPMIVVMPDAYNGYGGSFYANSAAGRWADFTAGDLVRHVDRRYRTVAEARGRAVAGWSMGGWGALHLAAERSDVFGAAYALSPCCLGPKGVDEIWRRGRAWRATLALRERPPPDADFRVMLQLALAATASPNPARPPLYADLPYRLEGDSLAAVPGVRAPDGPRAFVAHHADGLRRLRGLAFDAGTEDGFRHIPATARQLAAALDSARIPHRFEEYAGDHGSRIRERLRTRVLPFLSAATSAPENRPKR
jgi:S-formylglutathione hydrolase